MTASRDSLKAFLQRETRCVLVEVIDAAGSTPRDTDAWMLVGQSRSFGTIGGGQMEYMAIDHARLAWRQGRSNEHLSIPLGPEIGQCCGGRVRLAFSAMTDDLSQRLCARNDREIAAHPAVYVFGAGHVGIALTAALALLPVRAVLVDTRAGELDGVDIAGVETRLTAMPEAVVRTAPARSAFVILTHDHALDFLIAAEALQRNDTAYVGMIGSKTKRATFRTWLTRETGQPGLFDRLVCPIGGATVRDKRPAVIAALAAAEIVTALLDWPHRALAVLPD